MKKNIPVFIFIAIMAVYVPVHAHASDVKNLWVQVDAEQAPKNLQIMHPLHFLVYKVDEATLRLEMYTLSADPAGAGFIELPLPDGSFMDFKVWASPIMPYELAAKYPEIKTFTGEAVGDPRITAKMELTPYGFTAMIFNGANTSFVDPFDNYHDGFYMVHYKKDETRPVSDRMRCGVNNDDKAGLIDESISIRQNDLPKPAFRVSNGTVLRTYRLALCADSFYSNAVTGIFLPPLTLVLSKMTVTMNRVNGVYNRELSIQMNFCANEDSLIWGVAGHINGNDPFSAVNYNEYYSIDTNESVCTRRIGNPGYDLGHVFTTLGVGLTAAGSVCRPGYKAQSCSGSPAPVGDGFDIVYVSHEIGHLFNSYHTFNNNVNPGCAGNASSAFAYEPGSGPTIMDYSGSCTLDNLLPAAEDYFNASALSQIQIEILAGHASWCPVITPTGNAPLRLPAFSANYTIPYKTPFELSSPVAVDTLTDTAITYGWTQWNLGDFGKPFIQTFVYGPIFRSFPPVYSTIRIFPNINMVLTGVLSDAGTDMAEGEKAPDTARYLTFKMVARNIAHGYGCFVFPDDTVHLDAVATPGFTGFKVTSQSTTGINYLGHSTQTITWNVAGTNAMPVNTANVDIFMSLDGGHNWVYHIGAVPNTGSASVVIPNPSATCTTTRFKVKGSGNVFFNVNSHDFTVTYDPTVPVTLNVPQKNSLNDIKLFPVPANSILNISTGNASTFNVVIYNTLGQVAWNGPVTNTFSIPVRSWVKGVYHILFTDPNTGNHLARSFIVE